ncbi:MAG: class 1 fructose-bisphosphatase [Cyclobacteriaceae bacterium]|nr:class 1 fructose-bisphosphatase [Cyclobacteriaceae bacterium]
MEQSRIALPIGTTLDRFIKKKQEDFPFATGELSQLLRDLALAGKVVNREINKAGLVDIIGTVGTQNIQGEDQQKLDILADIRFSRALQKGGEVCAIASEENENINIINPQAKYIVCIDPLDGSSNINVNVSVGTLFSIYRRKSELTDQVSIQDALQPGQNQVAGGYILYGSSTILVYTTGNGVNGFTYEPSLGEYFLSHPDMIIPENGSIYSINEGASPHFSDGILDYLSLCKKRGLSSRYIGSLVADFHRNLLKGGIFLYPATKFYPEGKLRLLYECNPLAFIVEQAGGKATNGEKCILDILPDTLHQRSPFFIGSPKMVDELHNFIKHDRF